MKALVQYILPQRALSKFAGYLANHQNIWLKNRLIAYFINKYRPDLQEALIKDAFSHATFNHFFTRHLCPSLRPINQDDFAILSPVDGTLSQVGRLTNNQLIQAKGHLYDLTALLGSDNYAQIFLGGDFICAYLAPTDYHRVHMPVAGTLCSMTYIPGQLFSVNLHTASKIPNLYARNERIVCIFDTKHGKLAMILVGAMLVGSMATIWSGPVLPKTKPQTLDFYDYSGDNISLDQGQEMGHFRMGSTVIMVFAKDVFDWSSLTSNQRLRRGESLCALKPVHDQN